MSRILGIATVLVLGFGLAFAGGHAADEELPFAYEKGQQGCSLFGEGVTYVAKNPGQYFKAIREQSGFYATWLAEGNPPSVQRYLEVRWGQSIKFILDRDCGPSSQD